METDKDLAPLKEYAATLTAWLIERNTNNNQLPWFARLDEMLRIVNEDFKEVMRNLVRDGVLVCHPDLNARAMFEFTKPK